MITLAHLRALLERALTHTNNPAILRVPVKERTVEKVAWAYLSRGVALYEKEADMASMLYRLWALEHRPPRPEARLDLTEPGTAHALLVALAMALGLDPGVGVLAVRWVRNTHNGDWHLFAAGDMATFAGSDADPYATGVTLGSPLVAAEPDPLKALVLAVHHALG